MRPRAHINARLFVKFGKIIVSVAMVAALLFSLPSAADGQVDTEPDVSGETGDSRAGDAVSASDRTAAQLARTVIADGLNNPRHLSIGPDGTIYVAEAGTGGSGPCVEGAEGEECLGTSGSVTAIDDTGQRRVAEGLPSLAGAGGFAALGPSDASVSDDGTLRVW